MSLTPEQSAQIEILKLKRLNDMLLKQAKRFSEVIRAYKKGSYHPDSYTLDWYEMENNNAILRAEEKGE